MTQTRFTSGLPETACGQGSTIKGTHIVRAYLPNLLRRLNVKTLLDAPCGDCNWISLTYLAVDTKVRYIGVDVDPNHVKTAKAAMPTAPISQLDILKEDWPAADLILCRDAMQHWTNHEIHTFIRKWRESKILWLLATCHFQKENKDLTGNFHCVNLTLPPFNLGEPAEWIEDENSASLALWINGGVDSV